MDDSRNAMYRGSNPPGMLKYHMVHPRRLALMREAALSGYNAFKNAEDIRELRWSNVGEYIHALQDSYSHQRSTLYRDFGETFGIFIGHGLRGHGPDWTWKRPAIAMDMAKKVFEELKVLSRETERSCSPLDWKVIQSTVQRFVVFEPELGLESFGPFEVPTVTEAGYEQKIDILNQFSYVAAGRRVRLFTRRLQLTQEEARERAGAEKLRDLLVGSQRNIFGEPK